MSKWIRNMLATVFIIGVFSVIEPNCLNLINTKAYAEEKPYLKSIYLSEGNNIKFSEDVYSYIVDVSEDDEVIFIKAKPDDPSDTVKINGQEVTKDDNYKENLTLDKGKNKVEIEVEDNKTKSTSVYTVYVYRGGKDAVYLNDININGNTIGFEKSNTSYNIELDEGTEMVDLETILGEGNYSITANGKVLDKTNSIKLKFKGIGKYIINIGLKDEDTQRVGTYTLNIYLGISVSPNISDSINSVLKPNQWVIVNGRWRYNDAFWNCLKHTWFYDNKYKSYFYFNRGGNMETGWIEINGKTYYLNSNGKMQTGWLSYGKEWYLFDSNGAMETGWIEDDDKWYFLRNDGTMATHWIVSNDKWYYLKSSGVMQIGWIYYDKKWYYLNSEGAMETGWIKYSDEWYFLNSNGSMKSGEWFYSEGNWYYLNYIGSMMHGWLDKDDKHEKYYYFNEDGTMRTSPKTIDGYTYNFNEDGSVNFG